MTDRDFEVIDDQELAPETPKLSAARWMRENLFSSRFNSVLTIVAILILLAFFKAMLGFILDEGRHWNAVWTNLRLLMTQAYPVDQYLRMWVTLGTVLSLVGLSLAIWRVGGMIPVRKVTKGLMSGAALVALGAILAPSSQSAGSVPILSAILEQLAMTGGRLVFFVVMVAVFGAAFIAHRSLEGKDTEVHSLLVALGVLSAVLIAVWVVPFGRYTFFEGEVGFESGQIHLSTKLPLTMMGITLIIAYFVGRTVLRWLPERRLKGGLVLGWLLVLPVTMLIILRDPDWNLARDGGGFDFLPGTDVYILLAFIIGGGLLIAVLSNPRLGEIGRAIAGLVFVAALVTWLFPMLMKIRLLSMLLAFFAIGAPTFAGDARSRKRYLILWAGIVLVLVYLLAAINTESSLQIQAKSFLGGLILTFVLALTSIFLSFPIGVLMALGRTSTMPIFRVISTGYIELVRGIPFITVLIFFDIILVLFLPEGLELDSVTLAILAGTLFSAAYLAENVRGGLQAISKGQYEAAKAVGLSTLQSTVFIVLPQALRAVIPALVGQTIAIFKDTSLVAIIGLFDFLYIADKVIPAQTFFLGRKMEGLIFIAMVYWIFTFSFSRASLRIEKKLGLGER
jgi:general L-amino acid transport system permease protein